MHVIFVDASTQPDARPDAAPPPDADPFPPDAFMPDAGPCMLHETFDDLGTKTDSGRTDSTTAPTRIAVQIPIGTDTDLLVELLKGSGAFTTALHTGSIPLTGPELNYSTCGACLTIRWSGNASGQVFMLTAGTLDITQLAPNLQATLTGATFEHVTLGPPPGYPSTPVGDDCDTGIASVTIDSPLVPTK